MEDVLASRIINVSNRLPVHVGDTIEKSAGGLVSAFEDISEDYTMTWLGWPGMIVPEEERDDLRERLQDFQCQPVFLTQAQVDGYYHSFSNSSLWPLLHYFTSYASFSGLDYMMYEEVNRVFAQEVANIAPQGGLVWVHDYHLMLLPQLLREMRPDLKVGFFLHTPFPSYEIFRCHPYCRELLQGILGADLVGYHTFGYLRHFRSCVLRLLGYDSDMDVIEYKNRRVSMGVFPIGISWRRLHSELNSETCQKYIKDYRRIFYGKKMVLSVERLDYTKGIPQKLDVIEQLLEENPVLREHVVFVQVTIPSREEVVWNKTIEEEVVQKVSYINGRYSTINNIPIQFIFKTIPLSELCALYALADVALVTPLIDGMNLVAKEFVACQNKNPGVLILSEFAGAAQELFSATHINPYDKESFVSTLKESLDMDPMDAHHQTMIMKDRVIANNSSAWAQKFLTQLQQIKPKIVPVAINVVPADRLKKLKESERVLLFLDYDGTLRDFEKNPHMATPTPRIKEWFLHIAQSRPLWDVYLVSGRSQKDLAAWFADVDCGLIAEHGYSWRHRFTSEWVLMRDDIDFDWKEDVMKVLQFYAGSTPGSFVEEKRTSVVWHYRKSDPEFGEWKARLLTGELYEILGNVPVEVRHGQKIVEVCSQHIHKGEALRRMLHKDYDMVFCAGDDLTDEHMFQVQDPRLITAKVGMGQSVAQNRFDCPHELLGFLEDL